MGHYPHLKGKQDRPGKFYIFLGDEFTYPISYVLQD